MKTIVQVVVLAGASFTAACACFQRESTPPPVAAAPAPAASAIYVNELRPLLQERCGKCHFPGGKMHARQPFDDEATVRGLGAEKLSTRIDDDEGRRILRAYFNAQ